MFLDWGVKPGCLKVRTSLWSIFEQVLSALNTEGSITTYAGLFNALTRHYTEGAVTPFDFIVVDESQDISIAQMKFLAALANDRPNGLFFAGDLGQRIFQQPFSWKTLGVDIRGRSKTLQINYRTSHQIRTQADKLLDPELSDVDGITENRKGTISVFNGPQPIIRSYGTSEEETEAVSNGSMIRSMLRLSLTKLVFLFDQTANLNEPKPRSSVRACHTRCLMKRS